MFFWKNQNHIHKQSIPSSIGCCTWNLDAVNSHEYRTPEDTPRTSPDQNIYNSMRGFIAYDDSC